MKTAHISHGGINPREGRAPSPKKELEHLHLQESENGGHAVMHHFTNYEHKPEMHTFAKPEHKVELSKGHVLHHIAKHLNIPHSTYSGEAEMNEGGEMDEGGAHES